MEVVESKKFTTKFGNKVNLVIRAGSMTARNYSIMFSTYLIIHFCLLSEFDLWQDKIISGG